MYYQWGGLFDYDISYQCGKAIMSIRNKIVKCILNYVIAKRQEGGGCSGLTVSPLDSGSRLLGPSSGRDHLR